MKHMKFIPFILIFIGTFGLLAIEFFVIEESRFLTLTFAALNVLGLVVLYTLVLTRKKV